MIQFLVIIDIAKTKTSGFPEENFSSCNRLASVAVSVCGLLEQSCSLAGHQCLLRLGQR